MKKVRFYTWYWGNYCLAHDDEDLPEGFEPYIELIHGWENSEEFRPRGQKKQEDRPGKLADYIGKEYIKTMQKKLRLTAMSGQHRTAGQE